MFPPELRRYLDWDLGPRRPWEDALIDAHEWALAEAVQAAYRNGRQDAHDGHRADQEIRAKISGMQRGHAQC